MPERDALSKVLRAGFADAFQRNWGLRIDHILLSPQLAGRCADHAPVIAELA